MEAVTPFCYLNMTVRRGITRTVLLVGPWAVKVPSLRSNGHGVTGVLWSVCRGVLANQSEAQWAGVDGLCPVRFSCFGIVNVYPRCDPVDSFNGDWASVGPEWLPVMDRKPENLGVLGGRFVWVDYDCS